MLRRFLPQASLIALAIMTSCQTPQSAMAENRIDFDAGVWIPFLPDYTAASIVNGGSSVLEPELFRDDQIDAGALIGVRGLREIGRSETMFEYDLDLAGDGSTGSSATFTDPGPGGSVWFASLDGDGFLSTAASESATFTLESDVIYNSQYLGLRERFHHQHPFLGQIDLGIGFKHLGFRQDFSFDAQYSTGASGQYIEDLDTDYIGGELRGAIRKRVGNHDLILDFGVGLFNMDGEYRGNSVLRDSGGSITDSDAVVLGISEFAATVDLALRADMQLLGVGVRPGVTFQYISDIAAIDHPSTEEVFGGTPVSLKTESAYTLGVNVEILLAKRR